MTKTTSPDDHMQSQSGIFVVSIGATLIGGLAIFYSLVYLNGTASVIVGGIATSMVAAGIVMLLRRLLLSGRISATRDLRRLSPNRDFVSARYATEIEQCQTGDRIKMMGISLQSIVNVPNMEELLKRKAKEGVNFQFLIMQPDSPYLGYRYKEYEYRGHLNYEINQFADFCKQVNSHMDDGTHKRIELRFHGFAPRFFLFASKSRIFVQFYVYGFGEFCGPCFEFDRGRGEVAMMMEQSFDRLWANCNGNEI